MRQRVCESMIPARNYQRLQVILVMDGQQLSRRELQKLHMSLMGRMGHMSGDQAGENEAKGGGAAVGNIVDFTSWFRNSSASGGAG
jgi:hypothetical protein